jgi:hypothetical protein
MRIIEMQPVESSNIEAVGFGPDEGKDHGVLRVQFKSGKQYEYDNVPESVYQDFLTAFSPGRFFNETIRKTYQGRKVE